MGDHRVGPFLRHADRTVKVPLSNQEIVDRTEVMSGLWAEMRAAEARFEEAKATFKAQKLRIERSLAPIRTEIAEKKAARVQQVSVHRHADRHDFVVEVYGGEIISEREIEKADTQLRLPSADQAEPADAESAALEPEAGDVDDDDDNEIPWDVIDDEELDEVFEAGRAARRDGIPAEDNPYPADADEATRWEDGWKKEDPVALYAEGAAARESGEPDDEQRPEPWRKGWAAAAAKPSERLDLESAIRAMSPAALDVYLDKLERTELFDIYHRIIGTQAGKGRQSKTLVRDIKQRLAQDKHLTV